MELENKSEQEPDDELREEYDFSRMEVGVRDKYVERYREATSMVLLEPDVAKAFPTGESVNEALRLLIEIARRQQS